MFESEDLVSAKNEKSVILCLLEVARKGAQLGMRIPLLIQMEQEIDKEMEAEANCLHSPGTECNGMNRINDANGANVVDDEYNKNDAKAVSKTSNGTNDFDSQYNSETDSSDSSSMQQIVTNDLKSLHELVSVSCDLNSNPISDETIHLHSFTSLF